jgi:hypothetical protein
MQKVLSFNVHPLPILVEKIKKLEKMFLNKLVVVQYGFREDYYVIGKLEQFEVCEKGIIIVLNVENKKLLILNPTLLRTI